MAGAAAICAKHALPESRRRNLRGNGHIQWCGGERVELDGRLPGCGSGWLGRSAGDDGESIRLDGYRRDSRRGEAEEPTATESHGAVELTLSLQAFEQPECGLSQ